MWHTLSTWRLGLQAGFDDVERSHCSTVNGKILRRESDTTDLTVQSMWNLWSQRQPWLGMVPLSLMEGEGEQRRNGETKLATDSISILRVIYSISYKTIFFYGLQITVLRVPGKEEEYPHPPPEHHPAGRKILRRTPYRVGTALAPPAPIVSSPLLRFHTGSWSFPLGPERSRR